MQRVLPVPADLAPWLEAGVAVDSPAALPCSQFPAMVGSMLVVRLEGQVSLDGTAVPASAWISASTRPRTFVHHGRVRALGLVLRPEAGPALFDSARGLVNTVRPLDLLAGPAWPAVEQAVQGAADDDAGMALLWQFVRQAATSRPACEAHRLRAKALLEGLSGGMAGTGRSTRQTERRFAAVWGMAPKQFQVIARLNATLWQATAEPLAQQQNGADLAARQGYYDQSHMARDMRRLAGRPLQGLVQEAQQPASAHWPLQAGAQAHQGPDPSLPTR